MDTIPTEPALRLAIFLAVFALMATWEVFAPRRARPISRRLRWPGNLGIAVLNTLALRVLFPTAAVGVALYAEQQAWGLLPRLPIAEPGVFVLAVLILDLAIYFQHRVFHAVPVLWRLHRMHHADIDIDVTTGARFHPIEMILSMMIKIAVIVIIGAPATAVLVFEVLLNATSQFNHSNAYIRPAVDRVLRWLVVTPDMHRVHHSVVRAETDRNFGFNIPWWDRLFHTYTDQPAAGHRDMTIGLDIFREPTQLRLDRMLLQPFRSPDHPTAERL